MTVFDIDSLYDLLDLEAIVDNISVSDYAEVVGKYYPATLEEPAEYPEIIGYDEYAEAVINEIEAEAGKMNIVIDESLIDYLISDVIPSYSDFCDKFEEQCDSGYDEDFAYECWRDRQYESSRDEDSCWDD